LGKQRQKSTKQRGVLEKSNPFRSIGVIRVLFYEKMVTTYEYAIWTTKHISLRNKNKPFGFPVISPTVLLRRFKFTVSFFSIAMANINMFFIQILFSLENKL